MNTEYLVVGAGLTGATIARQLHDKGRKVVVVERRSEIGGNVADFHHESGIRINRYGPHYFRTGSDRIWRFVCRFSSFYRFEAVLLTEVNGKLFHWPLVRSEIDFLSEEDWEIDCVDRPETFEQASLNMMPRKCFDMFVREYSEKQWGQNCARLSPDLTGRFDVRDNDDYRLKRHRHQGIPEHGYSRFVTELLSGIPVVLGCDFLSFRSEFLATRKVIFTGSIDAYFDFVLGKLKYRTQTRIHEYLSDVDYHQPLGQINNPLHSNGLHIRTLEWKHMLKPEIASRIRGTVVTREYPGNPTSDDQNEYPFPDATNKALFKRYREMAKSHPEVLFCGRLGEYRYLDMDQAIARALLVADRLLEH